MKSLAILTLSLLVLSSLGQAETDYTDTVKMLKDAMTEPDFQHKAYERLAYISDTFGPRLWGSQAL